MKITEAQKRSILKIINDRAGEILDELKRTYSENFEDGVIGLGTEKAFALLREFSVLKIRIWKYK